VGSTHYKDLNLNKTLQIEKHTHASVLQARFEPAFPVFEHFKTACMSSPKHN